MATFENGLIPPIRVELIREDSSLSCQASRTRAKKHEMNALRGPPTPPPTTYASAVTGASPGPDRQLITSMANIEKAIVSNLTAGRGRAQRVTFARDTHGSADKRGRSVSTDRSKSRHTTAVAAGAKCDYPMCRHRTSHSRPECRLAKAHEEKGLGSE